MYRTKLVLAVMAAADGAVHTPDQLQRMFALIDQDIPSAVGGPHFDFRPSRSGPFDPAVYDILEALESVGLVSSGNEMRWRSYRLTPAGQAQGESLLLELSPRVQDELREISNYARSFSTTRRVPARPTRRSVPVSSSSQ
jgi:hypothetical protein